MDPGSGQLWMHPGKGDGTFGLSKKLNHASFGDVKSLSHRSSWNEDYYEDLVALRPTNGEPSRNSLWVYPGKGDGDLQHLSDYGMELSVLDEENNNHWSQAEQVVSIGSVNDDPLPNQTVGDGKIDDSDVPDMLVKKGGELYLYFGTPVGFLDMPGFEPILLGNADWQNMTLMAPGDLNGDSLPEIWARDKVSGKIHQYTSKKTTTGTSAAQIDLTVYGDPAARTASIGTGFTGAAYPQLSTDGDFEKDGYADLWSRDGNGEITAFPGRVLTAGSAFGPGRKLVLGGTPWSECQAFTKPGTTTPRTLCGPILAKFLAKGGTAALGYPMSDVTESTDLVGRFVHLRRDGEGSDSGSIYWHPSTGAWTVVNGIRQKWMSMGAETGIMGYPTSDEALTFDRVGWSGHFSGGGGSAIYWTPEFGSWSIRGTVFKKYIELGGPSGPLGYPTTDETNNADNIGRYNHFRHRGETSDTASLYWTTTTGKAWSVRGTIRQKWVSLGSEKSFLGYPQSDEYDVYGGPREDFSGGYIRHNHTTGVSVEHKVNDRTAHLRTDLGGDFNGDGRSDIATVYDFGNDTTALYVAPAIADGKFAAPVLAHNSGVWNWRYSQSQWVAGDFNGDGRDDLAALYGYDDGANGLFTFLGNADGTFTALPRSAYVGPGNWDAKKAKVFAGDFNGDGRDDVGMMYDHGGCNTGTHTFLSKTDGTFDHQFGSWSSGAGNWCWNESKHVTGDFNGDGRDDMLAMYGHGDGSVEMYTLLGKTDGGFAAPLRSWSRTPGNWDYNRSKLTSGDYNGDGRADAAILFKYDNGRSAAFTFTGKPDGGVNEDSKSWDTAEGNWYMDSTGIPVSGDNNKDGRDDISIMYNYATGATAAFNFKARTDGGFEAPVKSWQASPGTW